MGTYTSEEVTVLFVGHGGIGSNSLSLFNGFSSISKEAILVNTSFFDSPSRYSFRRILNKLLPEVYGLIASYFIGRTVLKQVREKNPDLLFVFKGNYLARQVLNKIDVLRIHYHPDDSTNIVNRTKIFNEAEIAYDVHFTSKKHNIQEISQRTGKKTFFIWYAYDERWQFRLQPLNFNTPEFKIGFIGHMRADRNEIMYQIAQKYGKNLAISGLKWNRNRELKKIATLFPPSYGVLFSSFVNSAPIQLGFLNSDNRDQHTARSFEIPASGGLLIAEDTPEHREIFGLNGNVLFFNNEDDLMNKISWVHKNPDKAQKIAENGYRHITGNANTWRDRSSQILFILNQNFSEISDNLV
jgi:hypothetical protein